MSFADIMQSTAVTVIGLAIIIGGGIYVVVHALTADTSPKGTTKREPKPPVQPPPPPPPPTRPPSKPPVEPL